MKDAWNEVRLARDPARPRVQDILPRLFPDFLELHGDRCYGDDQAVIAGLAQFEGRPVTVIAQSKGRNTQENLAKNFGMLLPEGYRKAIRLAKQAEKFSRPIVTFVDTAGAYPGKGAEERGQAQAIASCLAVFSALKVPVVCIVLSEGGSGGALAFAVADRIYMLEHAVFSILSPEGFASILWKDETRAKEAAEVMKMTSADLLEGGIIDGVIPEPEGGMQVRLEPVVLRLRQVLRQSLNELNGLDPRTLVKKRTEKFRRMEAAG